MRVRACLSATLCAVLLVIAGCAGNQQSSDRTLEGYAKEACALMIDFNDRLQALLHDFLANADNQPALANTVSAMGDLYDVMRVNSNKLGDPPNKSDGGGAESEGVLKSAIRQFRDIAASIRAAKSDSEVQAEVTKLVRMSEQVAKKGAELKKKYPNPELDQAMKAIPGCGDLTGV